MIVDFHTHIFSPAVRADRAKYVHDDPLFSELYNNPRAILAGAEDLIASMDEWAVDRSVILNIAWNSSTLCHETNQYLLEAAARFPQRLTAFGMVRLDETDAALREIEVLARAGARGVGEIRPALSWLERPGTGPSGDRSAPGTPHGAPHTRLGTARASISRQRVNHAPVAFSLPRRLPRIAGSVRHWGGGLPFYTLMPEVEKTPCGMCILTQPHHPISTGPRSIRSRPLWPAPTKSFSAPTTPCSNRASLIKEIESQPWKASERAQFLAGNALRLLGLS